jgi:phosphoenolpyruvate carboxykinase (ATP)
MYARMLGEKLRQHPQATVWLVNTGWTGGPFGEGHRMPIAATRALLRAALEERLRSVEYRTDAVFGFEVPVRVPGVESGLLDPRSTWADPDAYDRKAAELARMFRDNFAQFEDTVDDSVSAAGPRA